MSNDVTRNLKAISLFSGAMGLDLGLEKAGFHVLACVENDKNCVETIKRNRPDIKLYGEDIHQVHPGTILTDLGLKPTEVDLVVGGPPCQPFSTAGKRRSLSDFRGNVIIRFLDYVKVIQPRYFILENVRGIYYAQLDNTPPEYSEYRDIEHIPGSVVYFLYKEFQKLGYTIQFNLFDSSLYSVPQRRERFVMFGTRDKRPVAIPVPTSENKLMPLKDAIGHIQNTEQRYIKLRDVHVRYLKLLKEGQYWKDLPLEIQKEAMGKSFPLSGGKTGFYRRLSWSKPAPTLVTHPAMPATMLAHPQEMRPLSIEEYALIQQFPPDWKFAGKLEHIYKQIGNAVPVGLGYIIGMAIINHHKGVLQGCGYTGATSRYKGTSTEEFLAEFEKKMKHTQTEQKSVYSTTTAPMLAGF